MYSINVSLILGWMFWYLVFAECHHAPIGCVCGGEDVRRVVSALHTMVQFGKLREGASKTQIIFSLEHFPPLYNKRHLHL